MDSCLQDLFDLVFGLEPEEQLKKSLVEEAGEEFFAKDDLDSRHPALHRFAELSPPRGLEDADYVKARLFG